MLPSHCNPEKYLWELNIKETTCMKKAFLKTFAFDTTVTHRGIMFVDFVINFSTDHSKWCKCKRNRRPMLLRACRMCYGVCTDTWLGRRQSDRICKLRAAASSSSPILYINIHKAWRMLSLLLICPVYRINHPTSFRPTATNRLSDSLDIDSRVFCGFCVMSLTNSIWFFVGNVSTAVTRCTFALTPRATLCQRF